MLDDLKMIHNLDTQDALGIAASQWKQLQYEFNLDWQPTTDIHNVVVAGMGGSALAGLLSSTWPGYNVPFEIVRDYDIPSYINKHTLFISSSYSGNTEETLSAADQAHSKGAQIICMSAGGKLKDFADKYNYPHLALPDAGQPRFGALYGLRAIVTILEKASLTKTSSTEKLIHVAGENLRNSISSWLPEVPTSKNYAKQLALEMVGKAPVIYAGPKLYPAAYKWKISFNENAKNVAWCNMLPEFNHNEFIGWTSHPHDKPYAIVDLRSNLEHKRTLKRFKVTERLLSGKRPHTHNVSVEGENVLDQLLWAVALGDFVSLYTALINGLNPTPVDLIEKFKKTLGTPVN